MESKFSQHINQDEIVAIVCDLVRVDTTNPPGNEYLCKERVTDCMQSLGMEVSYYEKRAWPHKRRRQNRHRHKIHRLRFAYGRSAARRIRSMEHTAI